MQKNKRILVVTQILDREHPILGFFHRWVEEFAEHTENLNVIALQVGEYQLPENVSVYSLGKEDGSGKIERIVRFYKYVWSLRDEYDAVFVHMNPEYVVLAGLLWRVMGKQVALWYTHKSVDLKLKIASFFVDLIFTASPESFRLRSKKLHVMGHGIDVERLPLRKEHDDDDITEFITVGRIGVVKNIKVQIEALAHLPNNLKWHFTIVGGPATEKDKLYEMELESLVKELGLSSKITFSGPVPHRDALQKMSESDIFLHTSKTGSLDKVLLEALGVGLKVISSGDISLQEEGLLRGSVKPQELAAEISQVMKNDFNSLAQRKSVSDAHSIQSLIERIIKYLK